MRKIFGIILFLIAFVWSADYKPFNFESVAEDSASQQDQFDYMLQYKLYGHDFIKMGNDVRIPDKSGWNGTVGNITSNARLTLGGPILANGSISMGDGPNNITGPVRSVDFDLGNVNGSKIASPVCLSGTANANALSAIEDHKTYSFDTNICKDSVPAAPTNLYMPIVDWDNLGADVKLNDIVLSGNDAADTIFVPKGEGAYKILIDKIQFGLGGTNASHLYVKMQDGGRLTQIFVKNFIYGNHATIQVVYDTDSGSVVLNQDQYRGNLMFYSNNVISFDNMDYAPIQGSFISTDSIFLGRNVNISGQLLTNKLEIGNDIDGKNFRFVKFDPDTIDVKLDKYGGLIENDSTVIIPVELSDTATIAVYFRYCFDLKDGVTIEDFNIPPTFPVCGIDQPKEVSIPIGSKTPSDPIKVNVKVDTLTENEYLVIKIDSISGAILPDGKTEGELKIKIIDAPNSHVEFDTTAVYKFNENDTGVVDLIKVLNKTENTKFYLDSSWNDRYTLDSITGELKLVKYPLDYEATTVDMIKVTLKDTGNVEVSRLIPIGVIDVNEAPSIKDTTFTLAENLPVPSIIGVLSVTDPDKKTDFRENLFKIVEGDASFAIDNNGRITSSKIFNYEKDPTEYTIKVMVYDKYNPTTLFDTATVTIKIGNTNEGPKFNTKDTTFFVDENTTPGIIGSVPAIDEDGDKITYKIVGTVPFTIDTAGNISSTREFDYEKETGFTFKVVASDGTLSDTAKVSVRVNNVNEPCEVKDTTFSVKENTTGKIGNVNATDKDKDSIFGTIKYSISDSVNYQIDKDGNVFVKVPFNYEDKKVDSVKVYITDGEFYDTAQVIIRVLDEPEKTEIITVDHEPKKDTIKTNIPDHNIEYQICEGDKCEKDTIDVTVHKDTTVKVCNEKKTSCDQVVILFNDAPPVVTLTNAKSTDALIDYITIEEQKDDKIYVNKKENPITVTVRDTVHKSEKKFDITVKLDTIPTKDIKIKEYNYLIDESLATHTAIGNNLIEVSEVISVDGNKVTISKIVNKKTMEPIDTVQTVTYHKKVGGKDVVVSYKTDNLTGQRVSDYEISYMADSCTKVTYTVNDKKEIVKNKEGNIAYNITYDYVDDFGNKASATVEIIFDDIPPKVEILEPGPMEHFNTNAIPVKWAVNGETQDTLTLQRLEKGVNYIIRRYVDKAGNVAADTVTVLMNEAKDIDIEVINPVTKVDQDKVDEYYSAGHKYNDNKPYDVKFVDPKNDTIPDVIGVGFKVDIVLPSVSPTGSLATLDDITKNGQIPVDDNGNIVGASTHGIPVDQYVEEHCTEEFQKEYKKNGLNIPLYDVTYNLHLWVYTNNANYVNDFNIEFTLNDEAKTTSAGTVQMVIDWLSDRDGNVKAKNHHSLGTGAYITKLFSKSVAKHRCDYKDQKKNDKTVKKDDTMKVFGYKRPKTK